jgi:flagellin-specific chaperone FliS
MYHQRAIQAYAASQATQPKVWQMVTLFQGVLRLLSKINEAIEQKNLQERIRHGEKLLQLMIGLVAIIPEDSDDQGDLTLRKLYQSLTDDFMILYRSDDRECYERAVKRTQRALELWEALAKQQEGVGVPEGSVS